MKKYTAKNSVCLLLCLTMFFLLGCGGHRMEDTGEEYCRFTDSMGTEVVLLGKPERTAVLFSSFADLWQTAGGEVAITVGETVTRGFAADGIPLVDAGAGKKVNTEILLAYEPDFVILNGDIAAQREAAVFLRRVGIPCAVFRVDSFGDYLSVLRIFTEITERPDCYTAYGTAQQEKISELLDRAARQSVAPDILFIRAGSTHSAVKAKGTADHFVCAMLSELGARNIADDAPVLLDGLSMEAVLLADPEFIFFVPMGAEEGAMASVEALLRQTEWQALTAIREGNWAFLEKELFHFKPNSRFAEAYELLYNLLYGVK